MIDWTNPTHAAIAVAVALLVVGVLMYLLRRLASRPKQKPLDASTMAQVFANTSIKNIRFVRNKIVVDLVSIEDFDAKTLHDAGALGISIVGDTVKFYIDGPPEANEALFHELKRQLER